jgi:5-dehydro-2-deoxygluconokinase
MDCLEHGSAEAAMLVASHACSADMPSLDKLEEFIKSIKEKYGEMVARA